ncbi:MAG: hypothetical protein F4Y53_00825, partial [Proteobacteria bacterium]|nr:hypothetical protein [Pseudomonadota bacterium]
MSTDNLSAEHFVRVAFRLTAPVKGSLIKTAQDKLESIRDVWRDIGQVFCHFELDKNGSLLCVFGSQKGVLLGETVRDWLVKKKPDQDNIIWCEKLGKEYALVYILAGQVVQESFERPGSVMPSIRRLIKRAATHEEGFRIFMHQSAERVHEVLNKEGEYEVEVLKMSVVSRIKKVTGSPPMLAPYRRAVRHMLDPVRFLRIALLGALIAAVVVPGTWFATNWKLGDLPEPDLSLIEINSAMAKKYRALLQAPSPGVLLPAIHRAGLQFQLDKSFSKIWRIERLEWHQGSTSLTVKAYLPERQGVSQQVLQQGKDGPYELPAHLRAKINAEAEARGWQVKLAGLEADFKIPLDNIAERDESEVHDIHRFMPDEKNFRWDLAQITKALKPFGELETRPSEDEKNDIYQTRKASLNFSKIPWLTSNTVILVSRQLTGGPVILEAVELNTLPNGSGGFMNGNILFHTIWR